VRFGRYLALERELRGVSLSEVAERTKIPTSTLEAIEADAEARLPGRVYVLGYLGAYADAVGLDVDEVVLRYQEAHGAAGDDDRLAAPEGISQPAAPAPTKAPPMRLAALAVLLLGALAALGWFLTMRG